MQNPIQKYTNLSVTCADDGHALHLLQQSGDGGVVAGVQGVAVDPQVELEPAGVGVKGHLVHGHADVGHGGHLAVVSDVPKWQRRVYMFGQRSKDWKFTAGKVKNIFLFQLFQLNLQVFLPLVANILSRRRQSLFL